MQDVLRHPKWRDVIAQKADVLAHGHFDCMPVRRIGIYTVDRSAPSAAGGLYSAGIVVIYGLVLIFKNIVSRVYKKELAFFYGVAAAAVIFDLIFMRIFSRVEVGIIDFLVIGTVMDMLLDVIFVVLTLRESRYVRIKMGADH